MLGHFVPFAPDSGRIVNGRSSRFPRSCAPSTLSPRSRNRATTSERSRAFANYLSIGGRYSVQINFDSENTIGERFRVNRAHGHGAAFLLTVIERQQWQIGDSLLNCKLVGRRGASSRPLSQLGFPLAEKWPLKRQAMRVMLVQLGIGASGEPRPLRWPSSRRAG